MRKDGARTLGAASPRRSLFGMHRFAAAVALGGALAVAGCGGGSKHSPPPPPATARGSAPAAQVAVIRGWADALRLGRVRQADSLFALPAVVENGTPPLQLRSRAEIHLFDESLPCGARLVRAVAHHGYVLAQFKLTQRRGPGGGQCDGPGGEAATAFRVVGGKISEWRRIPDLSGAPTPGAPSAAAPQT